MESRRSLGDHCDWAFRFGTPKLLISATNPAGVKSGDIGCGKKEREGGRDEGRHRDLTHEEVYNQFLGLEERPGISHLQTAHVDRPMSKGYNKEMEAERRIGRDQKGT